MTFDRSSLADQFSTLGGILKHQADKLNDKVAFEFFDSDGKHSEITYHDLYQRAQGLAILLKRENIGYLQRALLLYPPGIDLIVAFFACFLAGIIAVPAYPPANSALIKKLELVLNDATPSIVLSNNAIIHEFKKLNLLKRLTKVDVINHLVQRYLPKTSELTILNLENIKWLVTDKVSKFPTEEIEEIVKPNDIAFIQYTSGSTSTPKGVMISHKNLLENITNILRGFSADENSLPCFWLPPYHDMGLIGGILSPLCCGVKSILMSPIDFLKSPFFWLNIVSKYKATISGGPNFCYEYCLRKVTDEQLSQLDLRHWKLAFNGAEPIRKDTLDRFYEKFKSTGFRRESFYPCYGLAESTVFVSGADTNIGFESITLNKSEFANSKIVIASNNDNNKIDLISSGKFFETVKIVNPADCTIVTDNQIGEIWLQGKSITSGYWNKQELTDASYNARINNANDDNRYLRTGDLGFIYHQQLYVTGRLKELIIINGKNYYPQDIEQIVEQSHQSIRPGQVVAFSTAGAQTEELSITVEITEINPGLIDEISKAIREAVSQSFNIYASNIIYLPHKATLKTTSGKLKRNHMKQLFLENKLPCLHVTSSAKTAYLAPRNSFERRLAMIWKQLLNINDISVTDNFFNLGGDSINAVNLVQSIEHEFKIALPLTSVYSAPTIESQAKLIMSNESITPSPITFIHPEGELTPIFAIHPLGGLSICYQPISALLGAHRPFYGLDYIDLYFDDASISVENLAKHYIDSIKKEKFHKKIILLGHSSGGLVAHHMASLCKNEDIEINMIIMFDSLIQYYMSRDEQDLSEVYYLTNLHNIYLRHDKIFNDKDYEKYKLQFDDLKNIPSAERIEFIVNNAIKLGVKFSQFERLYNAIKINQTMRYMKTCHSYKPGLNDVPILYFKSSLPAYTDPATRDWNPYTSSSVTEIETSLSHEVYTKEEHAPMLAKIIQKHLTE